MEEYEMEFDKQIIEDYLELVAVERVLNGYTKIAELESSEPQVEKERWSKKGGINGYIAFKLGLDLENLRELACLKEVVEKEENIKELFKRFTNIKSRVKNEKHFLFKDFKEFYDWYLDQTKDGEICCYCGVPQDEAVKCGVYKGMAREEKRGYSIEIERVVTKPPERNVYSAENCRLACHICNNAKSDFILPGDFEPIASGISIFWKNRGIKTKPVDPSIWNMK